MTRSEIFDETLATFDQLHALGFPYAEIFAQFDAVNIRVELRHSGCTCRIIICDMPPNLDPRDTSIAWGAFAESISASEREKVRARWLAKHGNVLAETLKANGFIGAA